MLSILAGALLGFLFSIIANAVTGPLLSLTSRHRIVALLAKVPLLNDRRLRGEWRVAWTVDSPGYPSENDGLTHVDSCLGMIAFSTSSRGYGAVREYLYVGKSKGGVVSGRWYDPGPDSYHGMFQMRWNGTCTGAEGKWIGWAKDGSIKVGELRLLRQA